MAGTSGRTADVFEPMTGEVQAQVALASKAEMRAAIENAKAAQLEWGGDQSAAPRPRADEVSRTGSARTYDELAELLAREHGKTIPDAKGDIQRGLEVVEFAFGIPHLMKGEYTDGAGPGIDIYSMRQPLGVVAGITPFNFPAMIPMWKFAPALACGNAFILKPSERDPGGADARSPSCSSRPACRPACSTSSTATRKRSTPSSTIRTSRPSASSAPRRSRSTSIERAAATGKRAQCFGGAKNHMIIMPDADMDQTVDALIGAGYGSAGERCMAISVAVPVGEETADELMRKADPARRGAEDRPLDRSARADFGPLVTRAALERVKDYVDIGVEEGATLVGRRPRLQDAGLRERFLHGRLPVRQRHPATCGSTRKRSSARC